MKNPAIGFVLYSVTAALFGALIVQASLARERVGHGGTAHSLHAASPNASKPGGPATEGGQVETGERETLDTPMSVWRHGPASRTAVHEGQYVRIVPIPHPRAPATPAAPNIVHRNAIGLRVTGGVVTQRSNVQPFAYPPIKPGFVPASGIGTVATGNLSAVRATTANGSQNFATFSRGTIGGSAPTRLGTPQPGVGGPVRVVGGINGSTFRPRR